MRPLNSWTLALAVVYFGSAKLGLELAFATPSVSAIWPPTGVALAALVLGGRRLWPGVALGAFAANATSDVPAYTALGIAVGNTLEAVVGASLLAWVGFQPSLDRLRDVLALAALAALLSTPISATIGVASLALGDSLSDGALTAWRVWWLGDVGGDLVVAPFLLAAITQWPYRAVPGRPLEAVVLLAATVGAALVVFQQSNPLAYLTFPFYIWAALRFLQPGAATVSLVVAAISVGFTVSGDSQWMVSSEDDSLLLAQGFSGVVGISSLILAAVVSQRRHAERAARDLSHALQTELLPPALPDIPDMETAAWYRAGMSEQEMGGDFYDVFEAPTDEWVLAIGDVCGKGPEAASLTALARYTLRAVARDPGMPSDALRALNRAILEQRSDQRFMTVAVARVSAENGNHVVTVSNGGHPLPLLVRANGEVSEIGRPGTLLGIYRDPRLADHRVEMAPGDALVLFTDGLNERRERRHDPTRRIWEMLRACAGDSASEIARHLQRVVPGEADEFSDDVALLVLRSGVTGEVALDLPATPGSAARAREALSALRDDLEADVYADLELLVTELVTNSIRHAGMSRGDSIRVRATAGDGVLRAEVSDPGPGFVPRPPHPAPDGSGGWGLYLAERLCDRWGVETDGEGTTVWIERDLDSRGRA